VQEPAPPECGGGVLEGGDTGQLEPATVLQTSTATASAGAWKVVEDAAGDGDKNLAPCWVLKEQPRAGMAP
jgi:hypothetical protein